MLAFKKFTEINETQDTIRSFMKLASITKTGFQNLSKGFIKRKNSASLYIVPHDALGDADKSKEQEIDIQSFLK